MINIDKNEISVIIPIYNGEATIESVLYSILNQTAVDYIKEIIVVNDGSTDNSRLIVESMIELSKGRIRLINTVNGGVSKARNRGMRESKGKWIALCDSDDIWLPDKIAHQVKLINRYEQIDFLGGNHVDTTQKFFFRGIVKARRFTVKDLCLKTLPQTSTAIFKKKIYDKVGGYDETQRYAEDGNFFMKIAAEYGYYYDPKQVVVYGSGKKGFGDTGLSANIQKMHEGIIKNIIEMRKLGYISFVYSIFSILIENTKYARREWIVKHEKKNSRVC